MKIIKLTKGFKTKVCDCHYDLIKDMKWHYNARYAMHTYRVGGKRGTGYGRLYMHRIINNTPEHLETDHINRDSLDNRCVNLRSVTSSENKINRRKFKAPRKNK